MRSSKIFNVEGRQNKNSIFRIDRLLLIRPKSKELRIVLLEENVKVDDKLQNLFEQVEPIYDASSELDKKRIVEAIRDIFSRQVKLIPVPAIPSTVPFWKNREKDDPRNPVQFIQDHYGEMRDGKWHNCGLTRPELKRDPQLYAAYAQWINPARHPEDALEFALGGKRPGTAPNADPVEAIERVRKSWRDAAARSRAKQASQKSGPS